MGAWSKSLRFHLLLFTVMLYAMSYENLQTLSSPMNVHSVTNPPSNLTSNWTELGAKCRFGLFLPNGLCKCRNAACDGFKNEPKCMSRDSGRHRTFKNPCYMMEHACDARKKRLYYWEGVCNPRITATVSPKEVRGEYCEGEDVFYCKHDGICKYDKSSKERKCLCKRGFAGPRCQHRTVTLSRRRRHYKRLIRRNMQRAMQRKFRFRTRRSVPTSNERKVFYNSAELMK